MRINPPCCITSRLCAGVRIGDAEISIEYSDRPGRGHRVRYRYYIDAPGIEYSGDDLQSGSNHGLQNGLESLLSFLGACGEAYRYGPESENYDLFPPEVAEWAYLNCDELGMLTIELEENGEVICE